jgi:hypothetical protein
MTISTTDSRISYNGNGVTTFFSFPYRFLANGDLVVVEVSSAGVETVKTLTTHYTIAGAGDDAGGSVTMLTAPASGTRLIIYRDTDIVQETDYISGDPFPAETHERALDRLTMIAQEIGSDADRAIKVPVGDSSSFSTTLPAAANRLDKFIAFNSSTGAMELSSLTMTQLASAVAAAYAAGSTADAVTYTPTGTGAVARSVQAKLRDMPQSLGDYSTTANAIASGGVFTKTGGLSADVWLWSRNLTGSKAVGADATLQGYSPSGYQFDIFTDDADADTDFMIGFRVRHQFGGSAMKGGREALSGTGWLTAASNSGNTNRNYVGLQGKMLAQSGDGGTNTGAGALGAIFGTGGAAYAYAAATNLLGIEGAEFNTFTEAGSSAKHMAGISIVGCQATRGATIDAGIRIGAQAAVGVFGPHVGWKWGVVFTDENGADPLYSGSTLIGTQFQVTKTILRGIDLSQFTMTEYILRGIYSKLTENTLSLGDDSGFSTLNIAGVSTNASLILAGKGTGSVYFRGGDGTNILRGDRVATSVNYLAVTPAVTTGSPALGAVGSDTNIDLLLQGKGTGLVRFGTHTGGADTTSNGYITVRDAAGNTRKLMTTA